MSNVASYQYTAIHTLKLWHRCRFGTGNFGADSAPVPKGAVWVSSPFRKLKNRHWHQRCRIGIWNLVQEPNGHVKNWHRHWKCQVCRNGISKPDTRTCCCCQISTGTWVGEPTLILLPKIKERVQSEQAHITFLPVRNHSKNGKERLM